MLYLEIIVICVLMSLICYLSTGNDNKNLNGLRSYPKEIQKIIKEQYKDRIRDRTQIEIFMSNLVLFVVILFIFGFFIKEDSFMGNFFNILILGEVLNLYDLLIIDLLWWRNSKRIRFTQIPDKKMYQDPSKHIGSFIRGIPMFLLVAIIDGAVLTIL